MLPHQERVVEEKAARDAEIDKLNAFICTQAFANLPVTERQRMGAQLRTMLELSRILGERIEYFRGERA